MGQLVYINKGILSGGSYSALLDYVDGDASDLPVIQTYQPTPTATDFLVDMSDYAVPSEEKQAEQEQVQAQAEEPKAAVEGIPWSDLGNTWDNAKYSGSTKVKRRVSKTATDIKPTVWHTNWRRCIDFARKYCVPMVMVWSNGKACGHCCLAAQAINKSAFSTNFQPKYKIVWCYIESHDSDGSQSASPMHFARGEKLKIGKTTYRSKDLSDSLPTGFPFTCCYWLADVGGGKKKVVVDYAASGFWEKGSPGTATAAKNAVSAIKSLFNAKMTKYKYDSSTGQYKE